MFIPTNSNPADRSGIIAYQQLASDDGKFALIELVAQDRAALNAILTSRDQRVIVFEVGKHGRSEIEPVFKRFKKDFSFDNFHFLRVQ